MKRGHLVGALSSFRIDRTWVPYNFCNELARAMRMCAREGAILSDRTVRAPITCKVSIESVTLDTIIVRVRKSRDRTIRCWCDDLRWFLTSGLLGTIARPSGATATRAKPAKAGDAKLRGYGFPSMGCYARRAAERTLYSPGLSRCGFHDPTSPSRLVAPLLRPRPPAPTPSRLTRRLSAWTPQPPSRRPDRWLSPTSRWRVGRPTSRCKAR